MNYYKHEESLEKTDIYSHVKDHLTYLLVIGRSNETHKRYQSALREFALWCVQRNDNNLSDISRNTLKRYREYLYMYRQTNGEPLTKGSKNSKLTPVKKFFEWCYQERYIDTDIAYDFEIPKKPRSIPTKILMHEVMREIMEQPDISTNEGLRDRVMMEVLYSTGIRRSEITFLKVKDIDAVRRTVKINESKNGQDRFVPIGQLALEWIERYLDFVRPNLVKEEDEETLFLTKKGLPFKPGTLASRIKNYIKLAEVDTRGSCHLFRHSVATQMLENGANIRYIQSFLGHRNLNTTEIYTRVSMKKLQEIHKKTHPEEKFNN